MSNEGLDAMLIIEHHMQTSRFQVIDAEDVGPGELRVAC
jgi:hypothetical protein